MNDINWLDLTFRWLHLVAAIIAVGGAVFARFALLPAMHLVPEDARGQFHEAIRARFSRLIMVSIALLLVTGFYNYLRNEVPAHHGQGLYHGLMGTKILAALAVFFIASALVGRSPAFEPIRAKRKRWLTLNVLLGLTIVAIGAILRAIPDTAAP